MTQLRTTVLLLLLGVVGVALTHIRIEQIRCMADIQRQRLRQGVLEQRIVEQQLRLARLRSPQQLERRVQIFNLAVTAPHHGDSQTEQRYALVDHE